MSMALSQGQIRQQTSMSVMELAMGNAEQQGEVIQKLMSTNDVAAINTLLSHTFRWKHLFESVRMKQ